MKKHEPLYILAIHYIDGRLAYRLYKTQNGAERRRDKLRNRPDISYVTVSEQLKIPI